MRHYTSRNQSPRVLRHLFAVGLIAGHREGETVSDIAGPVMHRVERLRDYLIRKLIPAAMFAVMLNVAWAAVPATLTSLRAVHTLSNADASQAIPVDFEATVVYSRGYQKLLFVQDGDAAVFV